MRLFFLLFLSLTSVAHAQHSEQPVQESSTDLRSQLVIFSIDIPDEKRIFRLERTAGQDYFLRRKIKDTETILKIDGREAVQMDRDFASKFLRTQYELATKEGSCEVTLRLIMKGESQDLCKKDDEKTQEFKSFIDQLAKRF